MKSDIPVIAIVGCPNVGKSTLFNRLIGVRCAVTSRIAGTTRDRVYHEARFGNYQSILVDTGGLHFEPGLKGIEADVQMQARLAVEEADLILFLVDGGESLTSLDMDAAAFLRKAGKPLIFIAHKADTKRFETMAAEMLELGLGEALPVSSIHAHGLTELEHRIAQTLKKDKWKSQRSFNRKIVKIALVGRPNVGKSSIVNAMLNEPRLIVSDIPGTTIDTTDSPLRYMETDYMLIDTAGLRKRSKRGIGLEKYSSVRSLRAISRCDVVVLVLDYGGELSNQDMHISQYVLEAGKGLIIAVNKTDLMEDPEKDREKFFRTLGYKMDYVSWAPVIFVSAIRRKNLFKILELSKNIAEERYKQVPQREFSIFLRATVDAHPPLRSAQKIKIFKGEQTNVAPPVFTFKCNKPDLIHFSYKRYLENEIRRRYGFFGTVIHIEIIDDLARRRESPLKRGQLRNRKR